MAKIIIITDLYGTLLHPNTYAFEEAKSALNLIGKKDIRFPHSSKQCHWLRRRRLYKLIL